MKNYIVNEVTRLVILFVITCLLVLNYMCVNELNTCITHHCVTFHLHAIFKIHRNAIEVGE